MNLPSNIVYVPLMSRLTVTTTGVAQGKSFLDLNIPQVRNLVAQSSAIFIVGLTEAVAATDFEWNVALYSGFDRDHQQTTPIDIATSTFTSAAPQGQRCADYVTVTNFLLESRLQVWWANKASITGTKSAIISAVAGFRMST